MRRIVCALLVLLVGAAGAGYADAKADVAVMKKRYMQLIAPSGLDAGKAEVRKVLAATADRGEKSMKSQIMDRGNASFGSWKELKPGKGGVDGDTFSNKHMGRMRAMAAAYGMPGSKLKGNGKLLERIVAALEFAEPHVRGGGKRRGNWWAWDVGIPRHLADTLLLTEGKLPKELYAKMEAALLALVKKKYADNFRSGGANVLYVAQNQLRVAMLTGRTEYAVNAAGSYSRMSAAGKGMGIQKDWSYHFHGHGLNMGYGEVHLAYVSQFIYLTGGTAFTLTKEAMKTHEDWFRNFIVWNWFRGRVSAFSVGRSIARDGRIGRPGALEAAVCLYLCEDCTCRDLALSFIAEWYRANPDRRFVSPALAALGPQFEKAMEKAEPMPTGARYYPLSDYLACRGGGFYAAVRMCSTRTKSSFSIREENLRARRTGDGTLVLMTDGSEWNNEVIPTMNWYGLSGTTTAYGFKAAAERPGHSTVVSGLGHRGRCGAAGFDFTVKVGKAALRAMKSYAVLDGAVVQVGTGVRLENAKLEKGNTVNTYIHQCPLRDSDKTLLVNGKTVALADGKKTLEKVEWMHVRNYGYRFPEPCDVNLAVGTTTRGFKYINGRYNSDRTYTARFYTLSVDHGAQPADGRYAAVIFPGVTANEMRARAGKLGVKVITAGEGHLVKDEKSGVSFCFFYGKGEVEGFRAERPLIAAVSAEGGKVYLTVQDPVHRGKDVSLRIPLKASGTGAKADGDGTVVTVKLNGGFPSTVELSK